ncbi:MAG: hypothetical protein IJ861_00645 [Clostridia bacterium]|nr:hypothetical protein [Clostridia bacterium]
MIFNEIYGAYYSTVAKLIKAASENALNEQKMREIIKENAFSESLAVIESALKEERWQLIRSDGITPIKNPPDLPMTLLLQRWIKAVCLDPRIRLFGYEDPLSDEIEPLFTSEDIFLYDQYADGDDYTSEEYITIFRTILSAIKDKNPCLSQQKTKRKIFLLRLICQRQQIYLTGGNEVAFNDYNDRRKNTGARLSAL